VMETGGAGDRESPKSFKRNKRDPLMRPRSANTIRPAAMASVALKGRIHERTRPISKMLSKSLAPAGPSIHEALDEGILLWLAGRDVVPRDLPLLRPA
jgi:hypothetical protein